MRRRSGSGPATTRVVVIVLVLLAALVAPAAGVPAPTAGAADPAAKVVLEGSRYTPLTPARILDTRTGNGAPAAPVGAGQTIEVTVAGRSGVAPDATAVALNVTATEPTNASYLKVWPTGEAKPGTSSLNFAAQQTIANLVVVKLGTGGTVSIYNPTGTVHVLGDVVGSYGPSGATAGSLHHALPPFRILDTRKGTGAPLAPVGTKQTIDVDVTGVGGVPTDGVAAVVLNVTATSPTATSYLKIWPTGAAKPDASTLNFVTNQTIPNLTIVKVGAGGMISIYNPTGTVHVIADVVGWYGIDGAPEGAAHTAVTPARVFSTRDGIGTTVGKIAAGSTKTLTVLGADGLPATGISAVVLNVTATEATKDTFITVYPDGTTRPTASNLNVTPGVTIANLVVAKVGDNGKIRFYNSAGATHVIADVVGWFGPEAHWSGVRMLSANVYGDTVRDATSAVDANGAVHVAWRESTELLYRKIDRNGNTLIHTVRTGWPVDSTGYGARYVQLAPQPDGGAVVVWIDDGNVMGARLDGSGRVAQPPKVVATGAFTYLAADSAASGDVGIIAMELHLYPSTADSGRAVYFRTSGDLRPLSNKVTLTTRIDSFAVRFTGIDVEPDGTTHLAWFDDRNHIAQSAYDVYYARLGGPDPGLGARVVSTAAPAGFPMSGDSAGVDNEGPKISVDATGRAHIAWAIGNRLRYASVDAAGAVAGGGAEVPLGAYQTATKYFDADVVARSDGTATLLVPTGPDASSKLVSVRVDATGAVRVPAEQFALGSGSFGPVQLHVVGGEDVIVGRHDEGDDQVFVTSTAAVGQPTDLPDLVVDDAHSTNASAPAPPREGTTVTMSVQVTNAGFVGSPATTARFAYQGTPIGTTVAVPALAPEATAVVTKAWTVPTPMVIDPAGITVTVDPFDTIDELTEANNTAIHQVPIWLRPSGTGILVNGLDETGDVGHDGTEPVNDIVAHLVGTSPEAGAIDRTAASGATSNLALFSNVPPGTYTLTATASGYALAAPQAVTVTRNPSDAYEITVSPSAGPVLWFNTWGDIEGRVTAGSTGLVGVAVRDLETGRTTTTDTNGDYAFTDLPAGTHHLALTATNYARAPSATVAVPLGGVGDGDLVMTPTTDGYLDLQVVDGNGAAIAGATASVVDSGGTPLRPPCTTDAEGRCDLLVPGGVPFRLKVSGDAAVYVPHTGDLQTIAAGDVVVATPTLAYVVGALTWTTRDASVSSWVTDTYAPRIILTHWWHFWGNYHVELAVATQSVAGVRQVRLLSVVVDGDAYLLEARTLLPFSVFGAEEGGTQVIDEILDSDGSHVRSNLSLQAVRIVDAGTRAVRWETKTPTSSLLPVLSHSLDGDRASLSLTPNAEVGSGRYLVEIDVNVGEGHPGDPTWHSAAELAGYAASYQTIVWDPSGALTFVARPSADPS